MERQIKFRAAYIENNKTMYSYSDESDKVLHTRKDDYDSTHDGEFWLAFTDCSSYDNDGECRYDYIGKAYQFTGVKDKGGKEIYEGDIISYYIPCLEEYTTRHGAENSYVVIENRTGTIIFKNGSFGVEDVEGKFYSLEYILNKFPLDFINMAWDDELFSYETESMINFFRDIIEEEELMEFLENVIKQLSTNRGGGMDVVDLENILTYFIFNQIEIVGNIEEKHLNNN